MTDRIENHEDIIDSRDVIARIAELESKREDLELAIQDAKDQLDARKERLKSERLPVDLTDEQSVVESAEIELETWNSSEEAEELKALQALTEEASSSSDWKYGEMLIRDSYFRDYAEQLAEDTCDMSKATNWPFQHIDWEAAANELKQDYFVVDFDGVDYWIRI